MHAVVANFFIAHVALAYVLLIGRHSVNVVGARGELLRRLIRQLLSLGRLPRQSRFVLSHLSILLVERPEQLL